MYNTEPRRPLGKLSLLGPSAIAFAARDGNERANEGPEGNRNNSD